VIARANILARRSSTPPARATPGSRLSGHGSTTLRDRASPALPYHIYPTDQPRHVLNAARNLVDLDQKQVDAVDTRIELDLRVGLAFTRFLTLSLQALGGPLQEMVISYGEDSCPYIVP
jgi:hypothetical protein